MNINGLNKPPIGFFKRLFSQYSLIALQETKFSSSDVVRRVTIFSKVCDSKSVCFWSHKTNPNFSMERGRDGVGLLLSGNHPFHEVKDVTVNYIQPTQSVSLDNHYLVVRAQIEEFTTFIHVVYALVQLADRKIIFEHLPTRFPDDSHHLVLGDFNVTMDPVVDEVTPYQHDLGKTDFFSWQVRLGVTDAWRHWNPDKREFTGPRRENITFVKSPISLTKGFIMKTIYPSGSPFKPTTNPISHPCPGNVQGFLSLIWINCVIDYAVESMIILERYSTNTKGQTQFSLGKWPKNLKIKIWKRTAN
ncbi:Pol Polyprotein [Phytophthora megakarya]|uniref:Pol Polyprotein n=1 Tax=Phytophthora megakarya TaxID=4795 RepID=A0A225WN29_9STRA|nr:Pol Polyprotein [Phytophthora megakarya]